MAFRVEVTVRETAVDAHLKQHPVVRAVGRKVLAEPERGVGGETVVTRLRRTGND